MDRSRGQASIETALLLPALLALTLACWQALLVGWTAISAEHAARAAARARLVGAPVQPAAAGALPGAMRGGLQVQHLRRHRLGAGLRAARDPRLLAVADRRRAGGRAVRRRQSGQSSVEMIGCAVLLALATVAVLEALTIVRARITAERVADQAAVLVGEGRPLPASLRGAARIERRGDRVVVTVPLPVRLPALPAAAVVTATVPR